MIRVLVVEDSMTVRKRLVETLSADPNIEVVAEARDGREGIELCQSLRPDVVTLDMMMPVMDGLAATEHIMAFCPTPILVVSASTNRGEAIKTFEALTAGAIDVLDKPSADVDDAAWERRLVTTVKLVSRIRVITHPRARLGLRGGRAAPRDLQPAEAIVASSAPGDARIVAIGASTGGPGAVRELLRGLGADFSLPVALVVHVAQPFGASFVEWLAGESPMPVAMARDGDPLPAPGRCQVAVAPADRHLVIDRGRYRLTTTPERHACRPSVDELFESVAREMGPEATGCLLTGMGRDGAAGLLAMKRAGAQTMAQDEASCAVFGMPREALLLGAVEGTTALPAMATALRRAARMRFSGPVTTERRP